jgi:hypothetical protein
MLSAVLDDPTQLDAGGFEPRRDAVQLGLRGGLERDGVCSGG